MDLKKNFFLFLLGLVVGGFLTLTFTKGKSSTTVKSEQETQEKLADCEAQKDQISEKLKFLDESSAGKSSDEILAEMMKIFVADWGLKLKFKSAEGKCDLPKPTPVDAVTPSTVPTSKPEIMSSAAIPAEPKTSEVIAKKNDSKIQQRWENSIIHSQSEEEALQSAEKARVPDLFSVYSETSDVTTKDIQALEGKFTGGFKPQSGKQKNIDIELELEIKKRSQPPEGVYTLTEFSEGKQTSRSSGKGVFKGFSVLKGNQAIFIERSGGDNVMQLYYVPALEELIGNDYIKSSKSKLEYNGQVILRKNN